MILLGSRELGGKLFLVYSKYWYPVLVYAPMHQS
jgi:hypothetical protein